MDNDFISVRMTDGYGIANDYKVKNACPHCGKKLIIKGQNNGCYDGEWTYTDKISCENGCFFYYQELKRFNNIEE